MSTNAFFIEKKEYNNNGCITYSYTLCYQSYGARYYDDYIRLISGETYDEYFDKAIEYGASTMYHTYYGKQALFKVEKQAELFLEWVESRIILNKLIN